MKTLTHISWFELLKIQEDIGLTEFTIEIRKVGKTNVLPWDFEWTIKEEVIGDFYSIHSKHLQTMLPYYMVKYNKEDGTTGTIYAN